MLGRVVCLPRLFRLSEGLKQCWLNKRTMTTMFEDVVPPDVVNLRMGAPGDAVLLKSAEMLKNATQEVMSRPSATSWLTYGAEFGAPEFRTELAKFLSNQYRTPVDQDSLIQTNGASYGLYLTSSMVFGPGDLVFTERLSYFLALQMLKNGLRLNVQGVDFDSNGISPEALERSIEAHSDNFKRWNKTKPRPYWAMVYLQPTFNNPTGYTLSPDNCSKIVALARKYHLLIVCDDVYDVLYFPHHFPNGPPKRLFTYDNKSDSDYQGNVVSVGTFAKLFGPGVRLGWIEAPNRIIEIYKKSFLWLSGGAPNHMISGLMTSIMAKGQLDKLVDFSRKLNEERCDVVCSTLQSVAPKVAFDCPKGGYFVWFRLPDECSLSAEEFSTRCISEAKIGVFAGTISSPAPTSEDRKYVRISFAYYEKDQLQSVVTKLGNYINSLI